MFRVLTCLADDHDFRFVVLAGIVCFLASLTAVSLLHRAQTSEGHIRTLWTLVAGAATGCGIWATHFIAILAYEPGVTVTYGIGLTAASLLAAVTITSAGLWLAVSGPTQWRASVGGAVVGGGIACMHYLGMWALQLPGHVTWSLDLVFASIALGAAFGIAALAIAVRRNDIQGTLTAGLLLTLAILSHHFTAMGAVEIVPDPMQGIQAPSISSSALAITIAVAAAAVLGMALFGAFADMRVREHAQWLHLAVNNTSQGFLLFNQDEQLVTCNDRYIQMYGLSPAVVKPGITLRELLQYRIDTGTFSSDPEQYRADLLAARLHRKTISNVIEIQDGRSILITNQPMPDGGWLALHEDITERRRAEDALQAAHVEAQQAHARLLDAFEAVPVGLVLLDAEDRYVLWNRRFAEIYSDVSDRFVAGARFEDIVRAGLELGQHPEAEGRKEAWLAERMERHRQQKDSHEQRMSGDRWVHVEERRTSDGGSIGIRVDISDLKRSEASFRLLFEANPTPMLVYDRETLRFLAVNDATIEQYGYSREHFLTMTTLDIRPVEDREQMSRLAKRPQEEFQAGRVRRHLKADGTMIDVAIYGRSLNYQGRDASLVTVVDLTERKRVEDEAQRMREFLHTIIEHVPAIIIVKDARDLSYALVNRSAEEYFGISRDKIIGKTAADLFPAASAATIAEHDQKLLQTLRPQVIGEYPIQMPDQRACIVSSTRLPIIGKNGEVKYLVTVIQDITEAKRAEARIKDMTHRAHHDPLTGLPNRAAFNEHLASTFKQAAVDGKGFALMCIDLDRFKDVNDVFGHAVGDALLREVSRRLQSAAGDNFVARVGGDEFMAIVRAPVAGAVAERMLATVAGEMQIDAHTLSVGLSIGAAACPGDGTDVTTLLGNADAALYRVKAGGRGSVCFFNAETDQQLRELRALQRDLESAASVTRLQA